MKGRHILLLKRSIPCVSMTQASKIIKWVTVGKSNQLELFHYCSELSLLFRAYQTLIWNLNHLYHLCQHLGIQWSRYSILWIALLWICSSSIIKIKQWYVCLFIFYCLFLSVPFWKESNLAVFSALFPSIFTLAHSALPVRPTRRWSLLGDMLFTVWEASLRGSVSSSIYNIGSTITSWVCESSFLLSCQEFNLFLVPAD